MNGAETSRVFSWPPEQPRLSSFSERHAHCSDVTLHAHVPLWVWKIKCLGVCTHSHTRAHTSTRTQEFFFNYFYFFNLRIAVCLNVKLIETYY